VLPVLLKPVPTLDEPEGKDWVTTPLKRVLAFLPLVREEEGVALEEAAAAREAAEEEVWFVEVAFYKETCRANEGHVSRCMDFFSYAYKPSR
jgi:hypothetical protein